jgi:hypothetical protein
MKQHETQLLWSLAVVVFLAGYFLVYRSFEDRIAANYGATADVVDALRHNDMTLAHRPALEEADRRLRAALQAVDLRSDRAAIVASFVRETARVAAVHNVGVSAIEGPRGDVRMAPRTRPTDIVAQAPVALFETIPLDLTINGSYRDLLTTIGDLSHARVLAQIDLISIERLPVAGKNHPLTARLQVTLERLRTQPRAPRTLPGGHVRAVDPA